MGLNSSGLFSSQSSEHYTPRPILERVVRTLGEIDLDPCSNPGDSPNVPARAHYTREDNGLLLPWLGRIYMNPPYGREIGAWVAKLLSEYQAGRVSSALALVPARVDSKWFASLYGFPVCFSSGRLRFSNPSGESSGSAPFPSAMVFLGMDWGAFFREFETLGRLYVSRGARDSAVPGGSHWPSQWSQADSGSSSGSARVDSGEREIRPSLAELGQRSGDSAVSRRAPHGA